MSPGGKISRRTLLRRSSALLASIAIVPAFLQSNSAAAGTGSKKDFSYQSHSRDGKSCATCTSFIPNKSNKSGPRTCRIIAGEISPNGWCMAYSTPE